MAPDCTCEVRTLEVPLGRAVATVVGPIEQLLADPAHAAAEACFVRAVLTDPGYVVDAKSRLQARFPFVVEVVPRPAAIASTGDLSDAAVGEGRRRLDPLDAALRFWLDVTGEAPEDVERSLLESVLSHVTSAEARA
jgi:exonuclease SbcD